MPAFFRKEPSVEAFQVSYSNASDVAQWCMGKVIDLPAIGNLPTVAVRFKSPTGMCTALVGNYVVRTDDGFIAMRESDFQARYTSEEVWSGNQAAAQIAHHLGTSVVYCECGHAIDVHTPHSGCSGLSDPCKCSSSPNGIATQLADSDERVLAWEKLAKHPALATCYQDGILLDAVYARITDLAEAEQTLTELAGAASEIAFSDVVENASEGLDYMLGLQRDVERVWGRLPDPDNDEQVSTYIREVVLCATDELHEVLAEVHWKPWKDKRGIKNTAKYREELADVMHFMLDLYLAAGLSGRDIIQDYMAKHDENLLRNRNTEYRSS